MESGIYEALSSEFYDCVKANASCIRALESKALTLEEVLMLVEKNQYEILGKVCTIIAPLASAYEFLIEQIARAKANAKSTKESEDKKTRRKEEALRRIEEIRREAQRRYRLSDEEERRIEQIHLFGEEQSTADSEKKDEVSKSNLRYCVRWLEDEVTKTEYFDDEQKANEFAAKCGGTVTPVQRGQED